MKRFIKRLIKSLLPKSVYSSLLPHYQRLRFRLSMRKRHLTARIKVALSLHLHRRHDKINFGFHLTEHCNLNCASCDNFSPLAEPEFIDVEEFTRDVERMGVLFGHECEKVRLLGGEPLLHPEIVRIMEIARKNFPTGAVRLLTNGILLAQQRPDFWRTCHDNKVTIVVTHYPIKIDAAKIRELAKDYDVDLEWQNVPLSMFYVEPVNVRGAGDIKMNFARCGRATNCPLIRHGRLYTCTFAPNVHNFSRKFGVDIPVSEADSINIYDENMTGSEILRRLAEPIPMCRFCNMDVRLIEWHRSERDINEWL